MLCRANNVAEHYIGFIERRGEPRLTPEPAELDRLEAVIRVRPAVFDIWGFCTGRKALAEAVASIARNRETAAAIAGRALAAFSRR
jgi:hypothetical protein